LNVERRTQNALRSAFYVRHSPGLDGTVPGTLEIQLLGEFRLCYEHQPVTQINTPRLQTLLAYLLLHRGAAQSRQQLAYLFWPDSSDSQARTNLRNAIFQLRSVLPAADSFLVVGAQTIQWRAEAPFAFDVADFEQALHDAGEASAVAARRTALERAIERYGGDLLPGCYEDWLLQERERLQQRYMTALDQLITVLEGQQETRLAIEYAQRLLHQDPLRESTYTRLMQLHAQAGDRAAALRVYHTCTTTLARELGVDPDPQTQSVYEHLLNLETTQPTVSRVRDVSPLVGRLQAWTQLQDAWRHAVRGHPTLALVTGEAGIGKTRLVEELVEWAHRQGIAAATAHCYAVGGNLALAPVQEWLRAPILRRARQELEPLWASEVARLLPELLVERTGLVAPAPLLESWQRQRLFEALARLLLYHNEPLLLVLDDIQWCDPDTIEWMQFLLRSYPQGRLLIVCTLRQEALSTNHPLTRLCRQLGRSDQLVEVELTRLSPTETTELATNLLGRPLPTQLAGYIYTATEGNPLFIVEAVRAEMGSGEWGAGESGDGIGEIGGPASPAPSLPYPPTPLPPKVLAVIQSRLETLSPAARELASIAGVIGRAFAVDVLAQARPDETRADEDHLVQGLDELWQQRIIRERGANGLAGETYDFSHDKIREVVYTSLSPIRRRHLHRRVAQALEEVYAGRLEATHAQIARHYEAGGLSLPAIDAYYQAAQVARQRSAFGDAISGLNHALSLLATLPPSADTDARELKIQAMLGPLLLATKGYAAPEVEQAFMRAWTLCQGLDDIRQRFQVLWGLGRFYMVQPNPTRAIEVYEQLLQLAEESGDPGLLLEVRCALGSHHFHRGAFLEARTHLEQSLAEYDLVAYQDHAFTFGQDPGVVAGAYLALTLWCLGYPAAALARSEEALVQAAAIEHPYSQAIASTYAAVLQQFLNQPARCRAYAEESIALAERYGFTLWLSMATFLRGWAQTMTGDFESAFEDMQRSIDLYRNSGAELGAAYSAALLGDTFGRSGQPDVGLLLLPQAIEMLARTEDRWCEAELHRLHGELYLMAGQPKEAEVAFQQAIQVAQTQQARQWELRSTVRLARLYQNQGRLAAVRPTLTTLVDWFDQGEPTPELVAAQELLA
jgi:DNA-binding SARP family transcriptional activator/predicted ATPase